MVKHIKYFFIQLFCLPYLYSDIPNFERDFEREMAVLQAERILKRAMLDQKKEATHGE